MIAKKDNKEYSVTKETKAMYLKDGYDIYNDDGKIIEYSPKKTVSYNEYIQKVKENEELKAQLSKLTPKNNNGKISTQE